MVEQIGFQVNVVISPKVDSHIDDIATQFATTRQAVISEITARILRHVGYADVDDVLDSEDDDLDLTQPITRLTRVLVTNMDSQLSVITTIVDKDLTCYIVALSEARLVESTLVSGRGSVDLGWMAFNFKNSIKG